ncbi:MAG: cache domain-containing protein [Rhodospirillales bacterium]|nr:cache domain-containing protein [Rhodospirillales bacterium]
MFKSKLFLRLFSMLTVVVAMFSSAIYLFSVPLIKETAYEIELNASHTILDNVFEMASRIHMNLEAHRELALDWHKTQLKNVMALASAYIEYGFSKAERGEISPEEARRMVLEGLRTFKYGKDDYLWVTDYNSVLLAHPNPDFQGRTGLEVRDTEGREVLATILDIARSRGEGFHTYAWPRLGKATDSQKLSYFKDFPKWGFVVGTGVYLDDIDEEVVRRKEEAVRDLRQALRNIRIAKTGYVYIFDSANHMIIHPNANIEGADFTERPDPATGRPISEELKEATDKGVPFYYLWDKPNDPNNYAHGKISWVRHFEGFDWYIASSVYVDELRRSSEVLGNRILGIAVAVMLLATTLGYFAARRLVEPINRLAETAGRVRAGDLRAQSGILRDDEIGMLATTFDGMIRRLRDNIATLDSRVRERTAALVETNQRLQEAVLSQQRTRLTLAEIEARQRLILDAIPASIAYLDRERRLRFVNRRWTGLVGRGKDALIGRKLAAVLGRAAHARIRPEVERAYAGAEVTFEFAFESGTGRAVVTKNTLIPEAGPGGDTVGMFVLSLDITDEKQTARHLMEVQRLEAVGQLSGGLAHDFNNLLSIILGNLAAAREKFGEVEGLETYLEPAVRAGRRGADITSRLLAFARRHLLSPAPIEVSSLVREIAVLLRRSFPTNITIQVPAEGRRLCTFADQAQLENALVNLALNARDAMPRGGRLCISVARAESFVEIRVEDSGSGFSAEALDRAFEPFYTSKDLGSGLGLSMVYGFVTQSGGQVRLENRPEGGSCVTLLLPRANGMPVSPYCCVPQPADLSGDWAGELVLLVEDDHDVRQVVRHQLVGLGYSVLEAASAAEAADLIEQVEGIDLVISDIVMSGIMNGLDLAEVIRRRYPAIQVVLISGFSLEDAGAAQPMAGLPILRKPFDKQELIEAIRSATHNRVVRWGQGP